MSVENYIPDFVVERAYNLTIESLKKHRIFAVFVDLDNTLIAWNQPDGSPEMKKWVTDLEAAGIKVLVVSNNSYKRVKRAVEPFGLDFVARAMKPFTFKIEDAMYQYKVAPQNVLIVGDQLMTDIRAANRAEIRSVLVKPLVETDSIKTKFNRFRERRMMKKIAKKYGPLEYKKEM